MTLANYRQRRQTGTNIPKGRLVNRNLQKAQLTQLEPDKYDFDSFALAQNVYHEGANLIARRGYSNLVSDGDILGIHIYEDIAGNLLYATQKDGASNSKIIKVDRDDGTTSQVNASLDGLTGQGTPSSTSLNGFWYWCNGQTNIQIYEVTGDTVNTIASGSETCHFLASDESRVWGVFNDSSLGADILRASDLKATDKVSTFSPSGTAISRATIGNSLITKFTALVSAGKYIVACGENRTEVHRIPNFAENSLTIFPADVSTLVFSFDNLGVQSRHAVVAVGDDVYLNPGDGTISRINVRSGRLKTFRENLRQLRDFNHSESALGYDQDRNLLLVSCIDTANNDVCVAFNTQEETFSLFTEVFADAWVQDKDNIYFFNTVDGIFDAFQETQYTDAGDSIQIKVRTQATDLGDTDNYKRLTRYFLNHEIYESAEVTVNIYADRGANGNLEPSFSETFTHTHSVSPLEGAPQYLGLGVWGGAGIDPDTTITTEHMDNRRFANTRGERFELEFSLSVQNPYSLRGVGVYYIPTSRPIKHLTFS